MSWSRYPALGAIAGVSEWILRKRVEELEKMLGVPAPVESVEEPKPNWGTPEPVELVKEQRKWGAPAAVEVVEELKRKSGAPEPVKPVVKKKPGASSKLALAELAARKLAAGIPVTRAEAAAFLGVSTRQIQRWEKSGKLRRCPNMDHSVRYLASDVLKLASARPKKGD